VVGKESEEGKGPIGQVPWKALGWCNFRGGSETGERRENSRKEKETATVEERGGAVPL